MTDIELRADCTKCVALCCVAPAFDRSDMFAFDKPAATPCQHLDEDYRCAIHQRLAAEGFPGCAQFDCLGAGQRVTQEVFAGRSWRDEPDIANAMFDAFVAMREVHELILLLRTADKLRLDNARAATHLRLQQALEPSYPWTVETLIAFTRSGLHDEVMAHLRGLRDLVSENRKI